MFASVSNILPFNNVGSDCIMVLKFLALIYIIIGVCAIIGPIRL